MVDNTRAERQRRYRERMKAAGFVQVPIYVPRERLEELHQLAKQLRDGHPDQSDD